MSQAARTERQIAQDYGRTVGYAAVLLVCAQVFAAALAAHANVSAIAALQRSLVNLDAGGGALLDPTIAALIPLFVTTYLAALVAFAGGLVLCWQAGRLAAVAAGTARLGVVVGRQVMLTASAGWVILSLLVFIVLQLDGTVSWVVGTLAAIVVSPSSPVNGTVYSLHPTPVYILAQAAALLVQALIGSLIAIALGGVAGRLGARGAHVPGARQPLPPTSPSPLAPQ